jgi:hypothetical protein
MNWDESQPPKASWLNQNLLMSRKKFLLTNGIYAFIGFACYYIFMT